ncbi:MAG: hypothetical protein V4447_15490 [Pseudomonadota bacterium]
MAEPRSAPRTNVSWRAAILVAPGQIVAAKVINLSVGSLKLQCPHILRDGETYQMMMEVPSKLDASVRTQVICKAKCLYSTLSDNEYRAGMKYFEVPSQHDALMHAWGGMPTHKDANKSAIVPNASIAEFSDMV